MHNNYLKTSQFKPITIVCLISFLLCFVSVKLSVFLGIILSFWLIMRAKPDGLLGLFLLYFIRYYFYYVGTYMDANYTVSFESRESLTLAGFPLQVETLACVFVSVRVVWEWIFSPDTYKSKFPGILFPLWLLAFIPVIIATFICYGQLNWTGGIRYLMITGSYFYGYILAKNWPEGENDIFIPMFVPFIFIMLLVMNIRFFWSHHGFLFLGLAGSFSIYYMREKMFKYRLLGLILLGLAVAYAMLNSITVMLVVVLSFFFSYLGAKKRKSVTGFRSYFTWFVGNIAILGVILFTAYVCHYGFEPDYDPTAIYGSYTGSIMERIEAKIFSDRLPLWIAAVKQIFSGEDLIISYIKPLQVPGHEKLWLVSSHNTILEALRVNGLFSGTVMLVIMIVALKNNILVLMKSVDPVLKSLAAAVFGVAVVGMTTGSYPMNMTVGFWIWSFAGLCHGIYMHENHEDTSLIEDNQALKANEIAKGVLN